MYCPPTFEGDYRPFFFLSKAYKHPLLLPNQDTRWWMNSNVLECTPIEKTNLFKVPRLNNCPYPYCTTNGCLLAIYHADVQKKDGIIAVGHLCVSSKCRNTPIPEFLNTGKISLKKPSQLDY